MTQVNTTTLRRRARTVALQSLFAADMKGGETEMSLDWLLEEDPIPAKYQTFARELLAGVDDRKAELDQTIMHYAPAWPVAQLPAVDRNILRIALFELKHHRETPHKTAINEAVEGLCHCVQWKSSVRYMVGTGVSQFVEFGPARVLASLIRRIDRDVQAVTLSDPESIRKLSESPKLSEGVT